MPENSETPASLGIELKPEVLWRAFTVDPQTLTSESFKKTLVPGHVNEDDPTKIGDGNEIGTYMSTNELMVEAAYAHTSLGLSVSAPRFNDRGSMSDKIILPQCGVICKVDTRNLETRKPKITPVLQGVYNNGFEGDEYIADEIPPENYRVVKLVLSRWANDGERVIVELEGSSNQQVGEAINKIKAEFQNKKSAAEEFARFLEGLDPNLRRNEFAINSRWRKYQDESSPKPSAK